MTPYAETRIPEKDIRLFKRIRCVVNLVPDLDLGIMPDGELVVLSCHMLAEAAARVWNLGCMHGMFLQGFNHSWVLTPSRNIIDVYPVATVGGPILVDGSTPTLWKQWYRPLPQDDVEVRYGDQFKASWYTESVKVLERELEKWNATLPAL